MFGPKRDEVTGEWRKLHNEELRDLYSSPSIIRMMRLRRMRWAEHVARMAERRNACGLLMGKPEIIHKLDVAEIGWVGVDWNVLAQDRDKWRALVIAVMKQVP
jgi:hypothetical protein